MLNLQKLNFLNMKKLILSAAILASAFGAQAQLAPGSVAPDFTVTAYQSWLSTAGLNGNGTYKLYDYLDAGYTVILDVSATWCGPCWNYHLGGALDDVYINHGPAGHPGVSASTTDDVMVIWIEGDGATADATMLDGSGAIGNWIEPNATLGQIQFPMANPASATATQINNDFDIAFYPTVYKICPNRIVTELGQASATQIYSSVGSCPPPATDATDAAMLSFGGVSEICPGEYTPVVTIQNNGTTNLTNATVTVTQNGTTISTGTFTGNLATYATANVTCSTITSFNGGTLNATVTSTGDNNSANGSASKVVSINNNPAQAPTNVIKIDVTTDQYASETTWKLTNAAGTVVAQGGPWSNLSAAGQTVRPTVTVSTLQPNQCYNFKIYDSYGDGICCDFGNGAYSVKDVNGAVLLSGGTFTSESGGMIKTGVLSVDELNTIALNVYPNPASDVVNISFEAANADYAISLMDLQGRVVSSQELSNANGTQLISFSTESIAKGSYIISIKSNGMTTTTNVVVK
jgi:hypothetical protein